LAARPPGVPVDAPPPIGPGECFRRAVTSLDDVLGSIGADDWHRPALRDLDVQGLVGHLIGVEHGFLYALDAPDDAHADDDHVESTNRHATGQRGRDAGDTLEDWRAVVGDSTARVGVAEGQPNGLDRTVALYGLRVPLGTLLVVRAFELWTHEEDVRRSTAQPLDEPDPASLRLMTTLAVNFVPAGLARAGRPAEGRSARIVLTGPGGGTWQTGLGLDAAGMPTEGPADVRIVAGAVDFCRLVANRISPDALDAVITGDDRLADDLLIGATTLALD
jgi:uncharacterized protein (TIGR03083 family)